MANNQTKKEEKMSCSCGCNESSKPKEWDGELISFENLKPGESAEIVGYSEEGSVTYKFKLLAMGLLRGRVIKVLHVSPFGDPVEILVMSYRLSLRKDEARVLKLRRV